MPIVGDNAIEPPQTCEIPRVWHKESALGGQLLQGERDRMQGDKLAVELFFKVIMSKAGLNRSDELIAESKGITSSGITGKNPPGLLTLRT